MAEIVRLPLPARPAAPVAKVLDMAAEKRRMRKEARQRIAFENAYRAVRSEFPDVDVVREPGAFAALLSLAVERLASHPDFAGEIETAPGVPAERSTA